MPDNIRMKRIEAFLQKELSRIVSRDLKDPVFENKLISFTEIHVSRDLSQANVLVSVLGASEDTALVVEALNRAEKKIRSEIHSVSDLRRTPAFVFQEDHAIEAATKIESILDNLVIPPEDSQDSDPT